MNPLTRFRLNSETLYSVLVCGYHESAIKNSTITSQSEPIEVLIKFQDYVNMIVEQIDADSTHHLLKQQDRLLHEYARTVKIFNDYLHDLITEGLSNKEIINRLNLLITLQADDDELVKGTRGVKWVESIRKLYLWFLEDVIISQAYLVCNTPEHSKYPPYLLPTFGDDYMALTLGSAFTINNEGNSFIPTSKTIPHTCNPIELGERLDTPANRGMVRGVLLDRKVGKEDHRTQKLISNITLLGYTVDTLKGSRVSWESYLNNKEPQLKGRNYREETRHQYKNKVTHLNLIHQHLLDLVVLKHFNRMGNTSTEEVLLIGYDYFQPDTYTLGEYLPME